MSTSESGGNVAAGVAQNSGKQKSPAVAALLELGLGIFQIFGVGFIYAGFAPYGVMIMLGYWALLVLNIIAIFMLVGMITLPLTWVLFMIFMPITSAWLLKRDQRQTVIYMQQSG